MHEAPDCFYEWTEIDFKTNKRLMKDDTPEYIRRILIEDEKNFYLFL